jgi:hypothetical protein
VGCETFLALQVRAEIEAPPATHLEFGAALEAIENGLPVPTDVEDRVVARILDLQRQREERGR